MRLDVQTEGGNGSRERDLERFRSLVAVSRPLAPGG